MVEVLLAMGLPTLIFGVFALLAMWLGAEQRPWFDERPVLDDRPNWWPIRRRVASDEDEDEEELEEPARGEPVPVAERAQPRPVAVTNAATSPSGV